MFTWEEWLTNSKLHLQLIMENIMESDGLTQLNYWHFLVCKIEYLLEDFMFCIKVHCEGNQIKHTTQRIIINLYLILSYFFLSYFQQISAAWETFFFSWNAKRMQYRICSLSETIMYTGCFNKFLHSKITIFFE